MLNRIKDKILHVLRKFCGYYELNKKYNECSKDLYLVKNHRHIMSSEIISLSLKNDNKNAELDKLSAQHEAKILEYDILFAKNEANILERDILYAQIKDFPNNYKKYLVTELEQILNIMKEKGIHPQDLIKRMVNKLQIDINNK